MYESISTSGASTVNTVALVVFLVGIILLTIVCTDATRRIPIHYSNKKIYSSKVDNYLPLKLNSAGVIPVIFALTLLTIPQTIAALLTSSGIAMPE